MSKLLNVLSDKLSGKNVRIVLPESVDARVLTIEGLSIIKTQTSELKTNVVEKFVERRRGKATQEQSEELLNNVNYFGTMLVYTDQADGLVSGAAHSTTNTVRPALQIIKTKP